MFTDLTFKSADEKVIEIGLQNCLMHFKNLTSGKAKTELAINEFDYLMDMYLKL